MCHKELNWRYVTIGSGYDQAPSDIQAYHDPMLNKTRDILCNYEATMTWLIGSWEIRQ